MITTTSIAKHLTKLNTLAIPVHSPPEWKLQLRGRYSRYRPCARRLSNRGLMIFIIRSCFVIWDHNSTNHWSNIDEILSLISSEKSFQEMEYHWSEFILIRWVQAFPGIRAIVNFLTFLFYYMSMINSNRNPEAARLKRKTYRRLLCTASWN